MKSFKKLLCFLLILTFCWSFSACSKSETTQTPNNETPQIEQPETNDEQDDVLNDAEVYTKLEMNDLLDIGSKMCAGFVFNFEADLTDEDSFDDNVVAKEEHLIEASEILDSLIDFENISCETTYKGELLTVEDGKAERVSKFYLEYWEEDVNGFSKLDAKIVVSYKNLDVNYTYDYYNLIVESNNKNNEISIRLLVEESVSSGAYNSKAEFTVIDMVGEIKNPENVKSFDVVCFERNKQLDNYSAAVINNSNIINFTRSTFDGDKEVYMSVGEGENYLRNPNSAPHILIFANVSEMGQDLNLLQRGLAIRTIAGLSDALISCLRT